MLPIRYSPGFRLGSLACARQILSQKSFRYGKIVRECRTPKSNRFAAVRLCDGYGNTLHWRGNGLTSFFVLAKYPPSLAYLSFSFFWILGHDVSGKRARFEGKGLWCRFCSEATTKTWLGSIICVCSSFGNSCDLFNGTSLLHKRGPMLASILLFATAVTVMPLGILWSRLRYQKVPIKFRGMM